MEKSAALRGAARCGARTAGSGRRRGSALRVVLLLAGTLLLVGRATALDVSTCATVVPAGDTGVLQADLECTGTGFDDPAVQLGSGAILQMNGHRIDHPEVPGDLYGFGVRCPSGKCTIHGPGEITGDLVGIEGPKLVVSDILIHDTVLGIAALRVILDAGGSVAGVKYGDLLASNVTLLANGSGILGRSVRASGIVVSQSEQLGIQAKKVRGTVITANDNGWVGIAAEQCNVDGLTATGNGAFAAVFGGGVEVYRGTARLRNATLTGNRAFLDGASVDGDIVAVRTPRLENVVCDHSVRIVQLGQSAGSLSVCSGD